MRWSTQARMSFIHMRLATAGVLNRADISKRFGVSTPQASADIKKFMEIYPGMMRYDASRKCFTSLSPPKGGRDTTSAADRLMRADDAELQMIVQHDPSMIRDVAAALIYERNPVHNNP